MGFKVYLKIPKRKEHYFFVFYKTGMDFPYRGLAIVLFRQESDISTGTWEKDSLN